MSKKGGRNYSTKDIETSKVTGSESSKRELEKITTFGKYLCSSLSYPTNNLFFLVVVCTLHLSLPWYIQLPLGAHWALCIVRCASRSPKRWCLQPWGACANEWTASKDSCVLGWLGIFFLPFPLNRSVDVECSLSVVDYHAKDIHPSCFMSKHNKHAQSPLGLHACLPHTQIDRQTCRHADKGAWVVLYPFWLSTVETPSIGGH